MVQHVYERVEPDGRATLAAHSAVRAAGDRDLRHSVGSVEGRNVFRFRARMVVYGR